MIIYYRQDFSGGKSESRRLFAEAVAEYTGDRGRAEALTGAIRTGEKGKPYIDGFDFFSISHTDNIWAVMFCERECGLDIQLPGRSRALSIAEKFFHPDDAAAVAAACDEDAKRENSVFFRLWTRREALIKAAGGSVADRGVPSVLRDRVTYLGAAYSIRDVDMPGMTELFAAVCVKGDEDRGPETVRLG